MALTGDETLQVLGQNPTGVPAATTFQTTTGAIAALAAAEGSPQTVTAASTGANISNFGVTTISSTSAKAYTMDPPTSGLSKTITVTGGTTTDAKTVRISTANGAATYDGTNNTATFISTNNSLSVTWISSARGTITANVGSVALSST
jgi:hypothetical protein